MDTSIYIVGMVAFLLFAISRELVCWYFKLSEINKTLKNIEKLLTKEEK